MHLKLCRSDFYNVYFGQFDSIVSLEGLRIESVVCCAD